MKPMLYTQRTAYNRMSRPRRMLHRAIWMVYCPLSHFRVARAMWRAYRSTWA